MQQCGRFAALALAWATAVALAGCGGGSLFDDNLSSSIAQGYAADAQAMPVSAGTALETATRSIEAAVAVPQGTPRASLTVLCANGGNVVLSVSGGSVAQQNNGVLDAGETYDATFNNCGGSTPGAVLDGGLTLVVSAYQINAVSDFTHTARALRLTTAQGRYTLNGSVREQRTQAPLANAGKRSTGRLSATSLALQSVVDTRASSYELRGLDWTVECTFNSAGALSSRSHQGTLTLAANTARRPNATLQVTTQGTLALGADGLSQQGSFSLATSQDRISVVYNDSGVDIALDLGNNGSIDRRWTLTRTVFIGEAG